MKCGADCIYYFGETKEIGSQPFCRRAKVYCVDNDECRHFEKRAKISAARDNKLSVIFEHYGRDHQMLKLVEESGEMIAALARVLQQYLFGSEPNVDMMNNLREEFADTRIVMDQLDGRALDASLLNILDNYKINRTVLRIFQELGTQADE